MTRLVLGYLDIAIAIITAVIWLGIVQRPASKVLGESAARRAQRAAPSLVVITLTAVLALLLVSADSLSTAAAILLGVAASTLSVQTVVDLATRRLPLRISHLAALVVTMLAIIDIPSRTVSVLLGATFMLLIAWSLARLTKGSLGRGDIHFSPMLGAVIGWTSPWPDLPGGLLTAWLLTAIAGAAVTLVGLIIRMIDRGSTVPYGPFMALGTLVVVTTTLGGTP
jgi:prepilin signal peptidase PulO-like enzyme (type II secretory pathway)